VNLRVVLVFYQDENGREHILYFADWWVLDIDSFVSGKHRSYIQALEDSVILTIDS
jgi:hypothetical protein